VISLLSILKEISETVKCKNCGWEWKLSDGGKDPYVCHKCGYDNSKEIEESSKGLWANIRAKRERGEAPAKKGSKAYKSAVKAAKEINKNK
jgi:predicted Zn-ribbon and HTH transcriptional regulator